jgi:flagellar biosynthesis protein FlhB
MNEKRKKILKIVLFALASGFFLYNGFSMLIDESNAEVKNIETVK